MARRSRIIVVDDEIDLQEALAEYLDDVGFEVKTAGTVMACERLLDQGSFDLIVLDLNLPGSTGLDYLARLRQRAISWLSEVSS